MFNIKQLINSSDNIDYNTEYNKWIGAFMLAILDILSNKSRDDKQNLIGLKKHIHEVLNQDSTKIEESDVYEKFKTNFEQLNG